MSKDDYPDPEPAGEGMVSVPKEQARRMALESEDMRRQAAEWCSMLLSGVPTLRAIASGKYSREDVARMRELLVMIGVDEEPDAEFRARLEGGEPVWQLVFMWGQAVKIDVQRGEDLAVALDRIEPAIRAEIVRYGTQPLIPSELEELADLVATAAEKERDDRWFGLVRLAARLGVLARAGTPLIAFPLSELALIEASNAGPIISERVRAALADQ